MAPQEQFLSNRQRYQPISLPQRFSDEQMVRDWTLSEADRDAVDKYRKSSRLFIAIQICSVRLYGRFLNQVHDLSTDISHYLAQQLTLAPSLAIEVPERKATYTEYRHKILQHLGFQKFDEVAQAQLATWLEQQARLGALPPELFQKAGHHLLGQRILLPGPSVLERLIIHTCSTVHQQLFESVFEHLSPDLRRAIDQLLKVSEGEQRSYFHHLKAYLPAASISPLQSYLERYKTITETGIDNFEGQMLTPAFLDYLFQQAKRFSATDIKRFADHKRYALMVCFLLETHKVLLDHLVTMHDQYLMDMCRKAKNIHEQKHRQLRQRQKKAVDIMIEANSYFLDWPSDQPLLKEEFWQLVDENQWRTSLEDLRKFKQLEETGYGDLLVARYPSLRKYFAEFIHLPFAAEYGNDILMEAIQLVRQLDCGALKKLPQTAPTDFVPKELRCVLTRSDGTFNRNAWEMGLALAIKDALRSGDLYLPQSKQHASFWDLMLNEDRWQQIRTTSFEELQQPPKDEVKTLLPQQFHEAIVERVMF